MPRNGPPLGENDARTNSQPGTFLDIRRCGELGADTAKERVIDLADGGRITLQSDGTMTHYDATGERVRMKDGDVMTAKDGARILMNNGSLWSSNADRRATRPVK